jgi:PPOX class probable F420-dependent enzyme
MRKLVEAARVGHLATVGTDGLPHVVPVCFALDGDVVYTAVDRKPKRSMQLRRLDNVRATGHACLLVDEYGENWSTLWWVRMDGRGRVAADRGEVARGLATLEDKYEQYAEQPPTGPVLVIDVTRWSGWSADSRR